MKPKTNDSLTVNGQTAIVTEAWRSDGDIDFQVIFPDRCSEYYALRGGKIQPRRKGAGWGATPPRISWIDPALRDAIKAQWTCAE